MAKSPNVSPMLTVRMPNRLRADFLRYCRQHNTKAPEIVREMIRGRIYPPSPRQLPTAATLAEPSQPQPVEASA